VDGGAGEQGSLTSKDLLGGLQLEIADNMDHQVSDRGSGRGSGSRGGGAGGDGNGRTGDAGVGSAAGGGAEHDYASPEGAAVREFSSRAGA